MLQPGIANGGLESCESQPFKGSSVLPGYLTAPIFATVHNRERWQPFYITPYHYEIRKKIRKIETFMIIIQNVGIMLLDLKVMIGIIN